MPKVRSPEERAEDARITRELLAIADDVVAGRISVEDARARTLALPSRWTYGQPVGNSIARDLELCLAQLGDPFRLSDVAAHAALARTGARRVPAERLCSVRMPIEEVVRRTGQPDLRAPLDGVGYEVLVLFGSPATGRAFVASMLLDSTQQVTEIESWAVPADTDAQSAVYEDLFDTLGIDDADLFVAVDVPLPRWDLMRVDDNGNEFVVSSYTGLAKANARMAELESHAHKQSYWLVRRT
jgi:hypothetical protein